MSRRRTLLENNENVNGVPLTLKVCSDAKSNKTTFVVSYKVSEQKTIWPKVSLTLAILFNMMALYTVKINITTMLIIVIVLTFLSFFWVTHSVQTENLLVIPTVGIQSSVKYVLGKEEHFVAWPQIDDIIINEVVTMNRVLYYLTVLVKPTSSQEGESIKLLPLFKYTKPRLRMIQLVYNELQTLLMKTQGDLSTLASGDKSPTIT